jgi:diguanylate cyclase (GGDEF)-like protein/PAS domain S-box-containing protein
MQYSFTEIFDIPSLTKLCQNFSKLTGKAIALLDLDGKVHISSGWQDICTKFHRVHPATARRCAEIDTQLVNQLTQANPYNVYRCKNGLVDVAVPVVVDGEHVGNLFTGQFLFEQPDKSLFEKQADEFGFDKASYLNALSRVPVFSEEEIRLTMNFLVEVTQVIGEMGSARLNNLSNEQKQRANLEALLAENIQKLTSVHKKYNAALLASHVGVWEWDIKNNAVYWSDVSETLWGMPRGSFNHDLAQVKDAIHPDDLPAWQADLDACLNGEKNHDIEFRIIHPDKSIHWIHAKGKADLDKAGKAKKMSGVVIDITEQKTIEIALKQSEENLKQAQKMAHIGSWELDIARNKLSWSDEIFEIFEVDKQTFGASYEAFLAFVHPEDRKLVNETYIKSIGSGQSYELEHRLLLPNGKIKYVREHGCTSYHKKGNPLISRGTVQDITDKKIMEMQIERIAYYDPLTDLPNRNLFKDRYKQAVAASKRTKCYGALLFIDLDNFKNLNDNHGHSAGDILLQQVGQRLVKRIRGTDTVARVGGDEFLVLLGDLSKDKEKSIAEAQRIAEEICRSLSEKYVFNIDSEYNGCLYIEYSCSASIGVTLYYGDDCKQENVINRADCAMYQAKNSGGNSFCFYKPL